MSDLLTLAAAVALIMTGLAVCVFLLFRAFWLWYWKVDEQVALLRQIAHSLSAQELRTRGAVPASPTMGGPLPPLAPRSDAGATWEIAPLTPIPESLRRPSMPRPPRG